MKVTKARLKEIIKEVPARKIVQKRPVDIILLTGSGKYAIEIPRSPWRMLFRYEKYWPNRGSSVSPNVSLRAFIA